MALRPREIPTISYLQQRNVPIAAGGWLSVSLSGNFLHLNRDERALVDGMLHLIENYQQAHPGVTVVGADTLPIPGEERSDGN